MTTRKSATDNGFIIFKDQLSILETISNEKLGEAVKLLLANFDELPVLENTAYEIIASNIRRYRKQSRISSSYGKMGGNPTLKGGDNPTLKGWDNPTHKQQEKKRKEKENNIKEKTLDFEFEEFWKVYPKQRIGNKNKAYSSYCRAIKEKRVSVEDLMKSVKAYANSKEVKNGYAKGCAAWLNDDRFNYTYEQVEKPIKDWSDEDWQNAILAGRS